MIKEQTIVFTGTLKNFSREEAHHLVFALGGRPKDYLSKDSDLLVTGMHQIDLFKEPPETKKLKKAHQLIKEGIPLIILSECEFLERVSRQLGFYKKACLC